SAAAVILLVIIFIGIISDMVGIASAVAEEKSFNARAAKKVFGSRKALFLIKHADRVSTVMCDIIGDICGTISGATGMAIVIRIVQNYQGVETLIKLLSIGLIAALTVGGKAFFKHYGIKKADEIIFFTGKILAGADLLRMTIVTRLRGV
ncbi:MAG TPA: hypothetical protein VKY40_10450, partial [Halanaerobiales bacterium]|nr:hypothetical protein [Halanaerobiales bacterium]